jgi:hypothetical protein
MPNIPARNDTEVVIPNSFKADLSAPTGGVLKSIRIRVSVQPPTGAVLVYGGPLYDSPVRFDGPTTDKDVPTVEPIVYIQKIDGTTDFEVWTLGWEQDRSR